MQLVVHFSRIFSSSFFVYKSAARYSFLELTLALNILERGSMSALVIESLSLRPARRGWIISVNVVL